MPNQCRSTNNNLASSKGGHLCMCQCTTPHHSSELYKPSDQTLKKSIQSYNLPATESVIKISVQNMITQKINSLIQDINAAMKQQDDHVGRSVKHLPQIIIKVCLGLRQSF